MKKKQYKKGKNKGIEIRTQNAKESKVKYRKIKQNKVE